MTVSREQLLEAVRILEANRLPELMVRLLPFEPGRFRKLSMAHRRRLRRRTRRGKRAWIP